MSMSQIIPIDIEIAYLVYHLHEFSPISASIDSTGQIVVSSPTCPACMLTAAHTACHVDSYIQTRPA